MAPDRGHSGHPGQSQVEPDLNSVLGQICRVGLEHGRPGQKTLSVNAIGQAAAAGQQMLQPARLHDTSCVPAHPEVTFHGSGVPERGYDLLAQRGILTFGADHRIDVGRGPADVEDQHVPLDGSGERLDSGQHRIGSCSTNHRGELWALGQMFAPDDVTQEHRPDGAASAVRVDHADLREHVVSQDETPSGRLQSTGHLGADRQVAGHHHRGIQPSFGQPGSVVPQHLGVATVGPAHQQDDVGPGGPQCRYLRRGHWPRGNVHDLRPGTEADPAACLGGDRTLVPHDCKPQATTGAGARQNLISWRKPRGGDGFADGPVAVHDVGARSGGHRRGRQ